jgi:flavin reductase (DIM6/NTAB) family NADH-FMN oxidoreductase RutF
LKKINLENAGLLFPTVTTLATCVDGNGNSNIITLGWSMKTSHQPPMVAISVKPSRHSHDLILENKEFVLAIPTMEIVKELHYCGRHTGKEVDKFKETGLTPLPAEKVKPPLIKECVANLECKLVSHITTGDHTIFVGVVVTAHVNEVVFCVERECLDLDKATTIVTHSNEYRVVGEIKAYKLNGESKVV